MDLNEIAVFVQTHILKHYAFFFTSLFFGALGVAMKRFVWTHDRAARSSFFYYMRAFLFFHPILAGSAMGGLGWWIFGSNMIASPGVEGAGFIIYYGGAGLVSTWMYDAVRAFMKARGVVMEPISMPDGGKIKIEIEGDSSPETRRALHEAAKASVLPPEGASVVMEGDE